MVAVAAADPAFPALRISLDSVDGPSQGALFNRDQPRHLSPRPVLNLFHYVYRQRCVCNALKLRLEQLDELLGQADDVRELLGVPEMMMNEPSLVLSFVGDMEQVWYGCVGSRKGAIRKGERWQAAVRAIARAGPADEPPGSAWTHASPPGPHPCHPTTPLVCLRNRT